MKELFDYEKAKDLSQKLVEYYDDILDNYKQLWISENRETDVEIFTDYIKLKKENVIKLQETL